MATSGYRGRFAPSPSGPLHFGSLLAALASYLDARQAGGEWLLRIEDIDPPREAPGAAQQILHSLESHGLHWDGPVLYQSSRAASYDAALAQLNLSGALYSCSCTRSALGPGGSCGRRCTPQPGQLTSLRVTLRGDDQFDDFLLGPQRIEVPMDQVLLRKDGLYAYALAVVVDDAYQDITHVLRGVDLLEQTTAQIRLHQLLGQRPPAYGHLPVLRDHAGAKLSKQAGARAIDDSKPLDNLRLALAYLGQTPGEHTDLASLLDAAISGWNRQALSATSAAGLVYPPLPGT